MFKTGIDYLKFRTQSEPLSVFKAIRSAFAGGEDMELDQDMPGKDGWKYRRELKLFGETVAWMDYGGDSQRGWLRFEMPGKGCGWVCDWDVVAGLFGVLLQAELTRVDLKLDTIDGSVSHESVIAAYKSGLFKRQGGGRNPTLKTVETSRVTDGRTAYIGARTSARFIRCYEKGWQVVGKLGLPEFLVKPDLQMDFDDGLGMRDVRNFYRVEAELKAVDGAVLPWTSLVDRDAYFAGSAPFCASLVDAAPRRVYSLPSDFDKKATLVSAMLNCKQSYGGTLNALLQLYGDSMEAKAKIFDMVVGDAVSKRLKEEGVLWLEV